MGRLKWSEYEYYTSSPEGFYYACKGYFDERQEWELWFRSVAFINYRVMGGKESHPGSIWPMIGDKRGTDTFAPLDEDQMVQLKKINESNQR